MDDNGATKITDYVNGFHYEDDGTTSGLQFFSHEEGRVMVVTMTDSTFEVDFEYTISDHLGNGRVYFKEDPNTVGVPIEIQETHYYAFGLEISDLGYQSGSLNAFQYNGKELQDELNLGWYDYGARMYDPTIAKWNGVDAMAEKYQTWSPYNYVLGNPIALIDPDGNQVDWSLIKDKKERRETKRYIRRLARNSYAFRSIWRDAKRNKNTVFVKLPTEPVEKEEGSSARVTDASGTFHKNIKDDKWNDLIENAGTKGKGANVLLVIDLNQKAENDGPKGTVAGHEGWHMFEVLNGLNTGDLLEKETRASHFENIVRKELDKDAPLRTSYTGLKREWYDKKVGEPNLFTGKQKTIRSIRHVFKKVNVLKEGFDYNSRRQRRREVKNLINSSN
jgi:RHS repeat-associated protein